MNHITYRKTESANKTFPPIIKELISKHRPRRVCEIGGGANPLLDIEFVKNSGIEYSIIDISEEELQKAPESYSKIVADIASPNFKPNHCYDLIFSKMLAEHIPDAKQFHANIYNCLSDGGIAAHYFPTLYALPFLANYLLPERIANFLLDTFSPRDRYRHEKFPAYYSWCRGPTNKQHQHFLSSGYEILEYRGYFGHNSYYRKLKPIETIHRLSTNYLLKYPNPYLTSYACTILQKPKLSPHFITPQITVP